MTKTPTRQAFIAALDALMREHGVTMNTFTTYQMVGGAEIPVHARRFFCHGADGWILEMEDDKTAPTTDAPSFFRGALESNTVWDKGGAE